MDLHITFDCGHTVDHTVGIYDLILKMDGMMKQLGGKTRCYDCILEDPEIQKLFNERLENGRKRI